MHNKLGKYIFQRICKDQEDLRRTRPMNMWGLYVNSNDIQRYIWEYTNYGMIGMVRNVLTTSGKIIGMKLKV